VLDSHHHVRSLALQKPLVTPPRRFLHRLLQRRAVRFQFPQLARQILLPIGQLRDLSLHELARIVGRLCRGSHFLLRTLGLLHQLDHPVFDLENILLAGLDLVRQRAVFVVLLGLKLLQRIFLDQLLLGLDIQLELFALGLDLLHPILRRVRHGLRPGRLGLEHLPLRIDMRQFILHAQDVPVAILQD